MIVYCVFVKMIKKTSFRIYQMLQSVLNNTSTKNYASGENFFQYFVGDQFSITVLTNTVQHGAFLQLFECIQLKIEIKYSKKHRKSSNRSIGVQF